MHFKKLTLSMASVLAFALSTPIFAKEINMYEQPKSDAKLVSTVDLAAGIIPIFTPKEGDWIKVADPRNGNVGWVKSSDLNSAPGTSTTIFTQRIINDGKGPHSYQIIEYGQPQPLNGVEAQKMIQKMQMQQQETQQSMQRAVQEMMQDMSTLYQNQLHMMNTGNYPVIMPVVIFPAQQQQNAAPNKPVKAQTINHTTTESSGNSSNANKNMTTTTAPTNAK